MENISDKKAENKRINKSKDRDTKGYFLPGHNIRGGRPKKRKTIIKEFIKSHPHAYDEMMEVLYELALGKSDKDAAQYICDRLKGRPTQAVEQKIEHEVTKTFVFVLPDGTRLPRLESGSNKIEEGSNIDTEGV